MAAEFGFPAALDNTIADDRHAGRPGVAHAASAPVAGGRGVEIPRVKGRPVKHPAVRALLKSRVVNVSVKYLIGFALLAFVLYRNWPGISEAIQKPLHYGPLTL